METKPVRWSQTEKNEYLNIWQKFQNVTILKINDVFARQEEKPLKKIFSNKSFDKSCTLKKSPVAETYSTWLAKNISWK